MNLVKAHLDECSICTEIFRLETVAERTIEHERSMAPGVFTSRLIMNRIDELNIRRVAAGRSGILRPVIIAASLAAALFAGIMIGSLYRSSAETLSGPEELRLINDTEMESLINLSNE
jgi:hypothetical protein